LGPVRPRPASSRHRARPRPAAAGGSSISRRSGRGSGNRRSGVRRPPRRARSHQAMFGYSRAGLVAGGDYDPFRRVPVRLRQCEEITITTPVSRRQRRRAIFLLTSLLRLK
jgi:hypothetical protein